MDRSHEAQSVFLLFVRRRRRRPCCCRFVLFFWFFVRLLRSHFSFFRLFFALLRTLSASNLNKLPYNVHIHQHHTDANIEQMFQQTHQQLERSGFFVSFFFFFRFLFLVLRRSFHSALPSLLRYTKLGIYVWNFNKMSGVSSIYDSEWKSTEQRKRESLSFNLDQLLLVAFMHNAPCTVHTQRTYTLHAHWERKSDRAVDLILDQVFLFTTTSKIWSEHSIRCSMNATNSKLCANSN